MLPLYLWQKRVSKLLQLLQFHLCFCRRQRHYKEQDKEAQLDVLRKATFLQTAKDFGTEQFTSYPREAGSSRAWAAEIWNCKIYKETRSYITAKNVHF